MQHLPRRPDLTVVASAFRRLADLRSARAFHPVGRRVDGTLSIDDPDSALGAVVGPGEHRVRARLSRGAGLPAALPDFLGLALRLRDDEPLDLLFTTTGRAAPARWLVMPARRWTSRPYSTVLPYRTPHGRVLLALAPVTDAAQDGSVEGLATALGDAPGRDGLAFDLLQSDRLGRWRVTGRLRLTSLGEESPLAFDPMLHADPRLRPVGFLAAVREAAYRGSRRGRGAGEREEATAAGHTVQR